LATTYIQNEDKQNIKAGTGLQTTEVKRSWTLKQNVHLELRTGN